MKKVTVAIGLCILMTSFLLVAAKPMELSLLERDRNFYVLAPQVVTIFEAHLVTPQGCDIGMVDNVAGGVFLASGRHIGFLNRSRTAVIGLQQELLGSITWDSRVGCWRLMQIYRDFVAPMHIRAAHVVEPTGDIIGFIDHRKKKVFRLDGIFIGDFDDEHNVVYNFAGEAILGVLWDWGSVCWRIVPIEDSKASKNAKGEDEELEAFVIGLVESLWVEK